MAESDDPERTPTAWAKNALQILRGVDPAYTRNREVSGRFIEFIRRDAAGLYVSHNFLRVRDTYYLSFALLFTTRRTTVLHHPLAIGSRFDHGRTSHTLFRDDLGLRRGQPGYPSGLWDFGPWRSNTMANLARGLALNEEHLYPFYRDLLTSGKQRFISLFERAREVVPRLSADPTVGLGVTSEDLVQFGQAAAVIDGTALAKGGEKYLGFGPHTNIFRVEDVPLDVIILCKRDVFLGESARLDELVSTARAL